MTAPRMNRLKRLWWKIVPPKEFSAVAAHVRSWLHQHAGISASTIEREINLPGNVEVIVYAIRKKDMQPEAFALVLIRNALETILTTGSFHTYRGVLNAVGKDAFLALRRVVADMQAKRLIDDADDYLDFMRTEIRTVG